MKVILLQDVEDVGKKYEVKEVKDGYARNFLVPKRLAKAATKKALEWLESQKEVIEKEIEEGLAKTQELASRLDGLEVQFAMKVGDEGQLFESVNAAKVAEQLVKMGYEVKKSEVTLKDPIKELGEFPVKINLDHNLEAEITVVVSPGEAEAAEEKI
ncbi:50S ribosomal protein L9 [Candidatus Parcubacteria bacterium]|nr:50S ribosomal protein L9 [Candidatus Parcubacteria bacterium]